MNMQQDEAFLSLLSSQRELLNQLNMEHAIRRAGQEMFSQNRRGSGASGSYLNRPQGGLTNRSIGERRSSLDTVTSKRLSLGLGSDHFLLPNFSLDDRLDVGLLDVVTDHKDVSGRKHEKLDCGMGEAERRKKRRLSSLGFLSASFFEDNLKATEMRSSSDNPGSNIRSSRHSRRQNTPPNKKNDEAPSDAEEDEDASTGSVSVEPIDAENVKVDPAHLKDVMEAFSTAMEKSQKSQQSIHDWDRKMGLKRSHSKTMRLSSRSRKKLRAILKKEITSISAKL